MKIDLHTELTFPSAFRYPLQSDLARREILWGALLLLIPGIGWLLNMGHRIQMVHQMQHGQEAWPAWHHYPRLFRSGLVTFLGMLYYYTPGLCLGDAAWRLRRPSLALLAFGLLVAATLAIPGYMTFYCHDFDAREIFNPLRALRRALEGGALFWKAWAIALSGLALSFGGLLLFGVGFLVTSVWFWQLAGYSFACVFSRRLEQARG